jgi:CDP-diacylglycerol--serine O-phosphatidyltransferase
VTHRQAIPTLITLVALSCGLGAIEATRVGDWGLALRLILIAAIADGIDGPVARRLNGAGEMGKQLDSLSDVISFGVAPAFLFSTYYADASHLVRFGPALAFVATGAYRLGRFNAQPVTDGFMGLPITVSGALLAVTVAGPITVSVSVAGVVTGVLTVLMGVRHPFPACTRWRWTLLPAFVGAAVSLAVWPTVETVAMVAGVILGAYVLWGVTHPLFQRFRSTETVESP